MAFMAPIMPFIGLAGTAISVIGSFQQASAASAAARTNAAYASYNRQIIDQNAKSEADRIRMNTRRQIGSQRAAFAAGGLATDSGSPLLVILDQALEGELAAANVMRQAEIDKAGINSGLAESNSRLKEQRSNALSNAFSTGVSGLSSAYGKYSETKYRNTSILTGSDLLS